MSHTAHMHRIGPGKHATRRGAIRARGSKVAVRGRLHFRSFSIKAELSDSLRAPLRWSRRISSFSTLRDCTSTKSEEETGAAARTTQVPTVYRRSAHPATLPVGG